MAAMPAATAAVPAAPATRLPRAPGHVLVWAALFVVAFSAFVLVGLQGWSYYTAPLAERPHLAAHRWLRPSAPAGHMFGMAGFLLMLAPVAYALRKKIPALRNFGSMKTWIDVHVFCGIAGPVLVTFHTTFKFHGIVSVAYWSMVAVTLSGFVGRYLYVRIPKSLRGLELSRTELESRAHDLAARLAAAPLAPALRSAIEAFDLLASVLGLIAERATLLRQTAYLARTKRWFDLWHVFHMPLVYVMFAIVTLHVALTVYMGYVPFRY
jgi:hypothetical protein